MATVSQAGQDGHSIQHLLPSSWYGCYFEALAITLLLKLFVPTGSTQGIAIIENLMEHLAKVCKEDPLEYRLKNMNMKDNEVESLKKIMDQLRESSNYEERLRQVKEFNMNNRWKKRGINLLPMIYPQNYPPFRYNAQVAILHNGGSVLVSHGGIEMGQGINTKVL